MSKNEKTAPDDSGVKGGMEKNEHAAALQFPIQHHIMTGPDAQGIAKILPHVAENAVSSAEVMRLCGITGIRQLRAAINADCAVDALILANTTGYYYFPVEDEQGWEEMQHLLNDVRSKTLALLRATRSARAALRMMDGQESIKQSEA